MGISFSTDLILGVIIGMIGILFVQQITKNTQRFTQPGCLFIYAVLAVLAVVWFVAPSFL